MSDWRIKKSTNSQLPNLAVTYFGFVTGHNLFMRHNLTNIRTNLKEIGWKGVDYIHLAQNRNRWWPIMNTVMNFQVP